MNNSVVVRFLVLVVVCFDQYQALTKEHGQLQCKGKPDGTSCRLACRSRMCRPPSSRCCAGKCRMGPADRRDNKADLCAAYDPLQCKGKPDGTSCTASTARCKAYFCAPPYSRCCAGKCQRGRRPVDKITNKADLCPSSLDRFYQLLDCRGKPDGTSCTLRCRALNCAPPYTRCCAGKCHRGSTPVNEKNNKADLCPSSLDKFGPLQCKGKPDGTSCTLPCRALNCAPPYTRCCAGECHRESTPVNEKTNKADLCPSTVDKFGPLQCKGKPDGTSCTVGCKAYFCAPPYSRCCNGKCHMGQRPVNKITNKTELCPRWKQVKRTR